jgi:hypothetical protein
MVILVVIRDGRHMAVVVDRRLLPILLLLPLLLAPPFFLAFDDDVNNLDVIGFVVLFKDSCGDGISATDRAWMEDDNIVCAKRFQQFRMEKQ